MVYQEHELSLYYECIGEGTPIVILHGLGCDHRLMKGCMEPVFKTASGYQRMYIDLPGMGKSSASLSMMTADSIVDVCVRCIQKLGFSSFLLVGESYGGYIARGILAKLQKNVEGLCLVCPVILPAHADRDVPDHGYQAWDEPFLDTLSEEERASFCTYAVIANKETYARYHRDIACGIAAANHERIHHLEEHYTCTYDVDAKIAQTPFQKPVVFICGHQDTCVGYADAWRLSSSYPRATFALIDAAGHNLQIEQPCLFQAHVRAWLSACEQETNYGKE